jgi:16S rRNA (uracil1498-N3)-methyltransferase
MAERRFFCASEPIDGRLEIAGDEFHHIARVMRYRSGDELEVVNGRGRLWRGRIASVGSRSLRLEIEAAEEFPAPSPRVIVAVSLTKGHAMNWLVEKLCEMGVDEVRPLACERTDVGWSPAQLGRWQKMAAQALKVNRRAWLTRFAPPLSPAGLAEASAALPARFMLDVAAPHPLAAPPARPALLAVGPPGDFSEPEKKLLRDAGFQPARLNDAVLKTETAALSGAAILIND